MYTQYLWPISSIRPISPMQCFYGPVCSPAFCEFYLTCIIIVYYVRSKGFSFNIVFVRHHF